MQLKCMIISREVVKPRSIIFNINLQVNSEYFKLINGVLGILGGATF